MSAITPAEVRELLKAATQGRWNAATAPTEGSTETKAEYVLSCSQPENKDAPLWVAWAPNDTEDGFDYLVTAITGDGPTSKANAELIAAAPDIAEAYLRVTHTLRRVGELATDWEHAIESEEFAYRLRSVLDEEVSS